MKIVNGKKNPTKKAKKAKKYSKKKNPQQTVSSILGPGKKRHSARVYTNGAGKVYATGKGLLHKGQKINPKKKAKKYASKRNPGAMGMLGKVGNMAQDGLAVLGGLALTKFAGRQINNLAVRFKIPVLNQPLVSQGLITVGFGALSASKIKLWRKDMMFYGSMAGFGHTALVQFLPVGNQWFGKEILAGVGATDMRETPVSTVLDGTIQLPQVGAVQELTFDGYTTEAVVEGYTQENEPVYRMPDGSQVNGLDGFIQYVNDTVGENDAPGGDEDNDDD